LAGNKQNYVHGSAARQLVTSPRRREVEIHPILTERRNKAKAVHMSFSNVIFIVLAVVIMVVAMFRFIALQSDVTNARKQYANLQNQYEDLKLSNDLYYENILSNVDLNEIERIAVEELGMKMAGEGQIVTYSGEIEDYVKQYSDLPQ